MWLHSSVGRASHRYRGGHGFEALFFFRLPLSSCLNWKIHCEDHSSLSSMTAVHMNYFIYTYIISLLTGRYKLNKLTSLPMCGFIAQLVEHRTGIAEVTGLKPCFFFRLPLSSCLNWKIHCEAHSSLSSMTAVHMNYFIYTYIISLLTGRYKLNKLTSLPMCGFIAQLVEHRTGIAEVTGLKPCFFFRLPLSSCLNWKIHCEDHSSLSSMTAVHINYFIYTYIISLLTGRYKLNKLTSLPMCGFIAQLVEHRTGIAEVTGLKPCFFFRLPLSSCLNWKIHCEDHSSLSSMTAVHINYFIYTYIISLLTGRYELNKLTSLPMCGFIAQLVEHRTGIAEVTGSNPVEALIFFRLPLSSCLNWKIHCEDHSSLSSTLFFLCKFYV